MKKIDHVYRKTKKFLGLWEKPFICFCEEHFKDRNDLVGCEIGVRHGNNAYAMLHFLPIKKLYLIDIDTSIIRPQVAKNKKVIILEGKSQDIAKYIPKHLDFVYIDGDHSYNSCYLDLSLYEDKTRILGGHDFSPEYKGVVEAVTGFASSRNYKVFGNLEKEYWMIIK